MKNNPFKHQSLSEAMRQTVQDRLSLYFGELNEQEMGEMEWVRMRKGEYLFRQNDEGRDMYVLIAGKMQVYLEDPERLVGEVYAGECVGETSLISEAVRSASVLALRDSALVRITAETFARLWKQNPEVMLNLSRTIIKRLNMKNRGVHFKPSVCRLICISGQDIEKQRQIAAVTQAYWSQNLRVKVIEESSIELPQLHAHLDELEGASDLIILLAAGSDAWQKEVIHHSDEIFYLAKESITDNFKIPPYTPASLILLYKDGERVQGVTPWLKQFKSNHIFRIRAFLKEDQERLARILAGRAVCWVFGGGGAHGFAHLGAVKALKEYGIPVDMVAGTSFGSIIAACFALGWDVDKTINIMREELSVRNPLSDYTLPMVALVKGKKIGRLLSKYFNIPAENTWKNFFCVAANLSANRAEIIADGPMDKAIRASTAIPGILPPQIYRKSIMVDGAVLNNLPADVMRAQYDGTMITIDLGNTRVRQIEEEYPLNNRQVLRNWLGQDRKYVPSAMNVIMKSLTLSSVTKSAEKNEISDLYINPHIRKSFLNWKAMDEIVQEGYDEAIKRIRESDFIEKLNLPKIARPSPASQGA